jgi:hypothetical protein
MSNHPVIVCGIVDNSANQNEQIDIINISIIGIRLIFLLSIFYIPVLFDVLLLLVFVNF